MNTENRSTKVYLKDLPPIEALNYINKYQIPTPYKEVLIVVCVKHKNVFDAIDYLHKEYRINLSYWTFTR